MSEGTRWRDCRPENEAWQTPPGMSQRDRSAEQDGAAGGRAAREMLLLDGASARGSIALRVYPTGRRIYAYLRWSDRGKTRERYVGEVTGETRAVNLAEAWRQAHVAGLLESPDTGERGRRAARSSAVAR